QFYSDCVSQVDGVHWLEEFGVPEAMWQLRVNGFATICTMDSHGNSLHRDVDSASLKELGRFAEPVFGH
ncbi:MAG: fumarate hydratase C-terminal domain-containing protein, partial [Planctomycetaceae bacterium]